MSVDEKDKKLGETLLKNALNNLVRKRYGFNVLFADLEKRPQVSWKKWETEPQTDRDVEEYYRLMESYGVASWGFVCGYKGLAAFDFDWSWVYRLWKAKFGARVDTLTVQTVNCGLRPHFLCEKPKTHDKFKDSLHVELKGHGRFVVFEGRAKRVDGEIGEYKIINEKPIREDSTIIVDSLEWLEEILRRYHFLFWNCLRPYFAKKVLGEPSHDLRLYIADTMACEGFTYDEIYNLFQDFSDYDHKETDYQIRYTQDRVKAGLKPPSCETLREKLGWSDDNCGGCERKRHQKSVENVKVHDEESQATVDMHACMLEKASSSYCLTAVKVPTSL